MSQHRLPAQVLPIAFAALLAAAALYTRPTMAAPLGFDAQALDADQMSADTAQGRAFRAGVQKLINGDPSGAKVEFEAAARLDPKGVPPVLALAGIAQMQGQLAQSEELLKRAQQLAPKSPDVQMGWGRLHAARGQPLKAEASFDAARTAAPKAIAPLIALTNLYVKMPGRSADAVKRAREAVALESRNPTAQMALGVALSVAGQRSEAILAFESAASLAPRDAVALQSIGRLQAEAGRHDLALAAFDKAMERAPKFVPSMLDRAEALARLGRHDEAVAQMSAADQLAPRNLEVTVRFGDLLNQAKRPVEAQSRYLQAIELDPRNPIAYNNLAWMTATSGRDAVKAVGWARKAVEISPRSSPFHHTLGVAERAAGNLPAALASVRKAIELEAGVARYQLSLALILAEQKQPVEAQAALKRAFALDPALARADEGQRLARELQVR
jgi:Flp pilus assembly protein TadD